MHNEKTISACVITGAISVTLSALVTWYLVTSHIEANLDNAPKIAIGGYESLVKSIPRGATKEQMRLAVEDMNKKINLLEKEGYLIIDDRMVLSAPNQIRIPAKKIEAPALPDLRDNGTDSAVELKQETTSYPNRSGGVQRLNDIFAEDK